MAVNREHERHGLRRGVRRNVHQTFARDAVDVPRVAGRRVGRLDLPGEAGRNRRKPETPAKAATHQAQSH